MSDDPRHRARRAPASDSPPSTCSGCGFAILERNYRTRWGELDIVAFDGAHARVLRGQDPPGGRPARAGPFEAVEPRKQRPGAPDRRPAGWPSAPTGPTREALRFDAIGVTFDAGGRLLSLEHLEGAF